MVKTYRKNGFTLAELLVVLVILGIIVSMGIPGYMKTFDKERERLAVENLKVIYEAQQLYRARYRKYATGIGLDSINEKLGTDLIDEDNGVYYCYASTTSGGLTYNYCYIRKSGSSVRLYYIHLSSDSPEPCCYAQDLCPSLPVCSCFGSSCGETPEL